MTLFEIISVLKNVALDQPNIRTASDGSVYDKMNTNPSVQYNVFHISQTNHQEDFETDYYGLQLFYISRLEDSLEDNRLQIQSIGKEILGNVIRTFCENFSIDYPTITYIPFTQKFNDLTAGVYCNVRLEIPKDLICPDNYLSEVIPGSDIRLQDLGITITQNGLRVITPAAEFDGIGEIRIVTDVPQTGADLQYKEVEYTENGEYTVRPDPDYDGLTEVAVSVVVPDRYDEGYDDGKEDGIDEQKAKLESLSVSANGEYTRADGYSAITVDVPQYTGGTYEEGYADGEAAQKAKLSTTSVTENGTYSREDGYSAITVNVPQGQGYEEGYADGEAAQKAKLTVTSFTQNDTYTRTDGWSSVTINVDDRYNEGYAEGVAGQKAKLVSTAVTENGTYSKPDGYSAITVNVDDRYNEGYADGFAAGASACSGYFITALTLNVDSAITESGTATTTYSPSTAFTNIYYTSSDPTIATIDSGTGIITVLSSGTVTICAQDGITHLQDCKQVNVSKSATSLSINIDNSIVDSATATTTVSPAVATTNLRYSSSDTSKATINTTTGAITVLGDGAVTFCVTDTLTSLQSCKEVMVSKTIAQFDVIYNVTSTTQPTHILNSYDLNKYESARLSGGTNVPIATGYTFPATGLQSVHYVLKDYTLVGFRDVQTVKAVNNVSGVKVIGYRAFDSATSLSSITLSQSVTGISEQAFSRCAALTAISIPSSVQYIGALNNTEYWMNGTTFSYSGLKNITIPTGVTVICKDTFFSATSLTAVTIQGNVTAIGPSAFQYSGIKSITLPSTVTVIQGAAFRDCASLSSITINATTPPTLGNEALLNTPSLRHIYVPSSVVNTYKSAAGWSNYASIISAKP